MVPLARREVLRLMGVSILGGVVANERSVDIVAATQESDAEFRIVSATLPATISSQETFDVGMTVENASDQALEPVPSYAFDGERVLSGAPHGKLPIRAGDREQFRFGGITLDMIDQSLGGSVMPGEHTHSIGFEGGPRESASVTVREGTAGDESVTVRGVTTGDDEREGRQRGFFTNSGNEPDFLSNAFNLTVLGFLLSVAGIVHQMLQGR